VTSDGAASFLGALTRRSDGEVVESFSDEGNGKDRGELSAVAPNEIPTDEDLLTRVRSGSKEAIGLLFRRHRRAVLNVARRILRDPSEAEDLCQEVFLLLFQKAKLFDPSRGTAASWIIQIAYHRAMNRRQYLAFRQHYQAHELNEEELRSQHDPLLIDELSARALVERLRGELTPDQQTTLELHFAEGYSLREIAEKTGQTLGNTRNHFYRSLERLRSLVFPQKGARVRKLERKCGRTRQPL
jgi:RNA polymerase sigma-70 factor, ECF subfamily